MKTQMLASLRLIACLVVALAFTAGLGPGAVLATIDCDPEYVAQQGDTFTVLPTGMDDTANLQCAFDAAVAVGQGAEVRLLAGDYHTGQIVAHNFQGSFYGVGANKTSIYNLPNLYVTPIDFHVEPPSADNPWAILFTFVGGDFAVSDLAVRIVGDEPVQGWSIYGWEPYHEMACAVAILGLEADAEFSRVLVEGEVKEASDMGYNLINGIYYEGWMDWEGVPSPPISGSLSIRRSTFRTHAFATPVLNLEDASVIITHNDYGGIFVAADAADLMNTRYEYSHNKVHDGPIGLDLWDDFLPAFEDSEFLITNNVFRTEWFGILFEQTFGEGNQCLLLGNNVQGVAEIGIFLDTGTCGCTVVGGSNKTNVVDLGTGNVLVGVSNMGSGVGPEIQRLRRP
jgi:hypothetical protein